jgi:hypothetical protein
MGSLRFHPSAPVLYAEARGRHARVFSIARRLLRSRWLIDRAGVLPGGRDGPTLQGAVAFDVAAELVALETGEP